MERVVEAEAGGRFRRTLGRGSEARAGRRSRTEWVSVFAAEVVGKIQAELGLRALPKPEVIDLRPLGGDDVSRSWVRHFLRKAPSEPVLLLGGSVLTPVGPLQVDVRPDLLYIAPTADGSSGDPSPSPDPGRGAVPVAVLSLQGDSPSLGGDELATQRRLGTILVGLQEELHRSDLSLSGFLCPPSTADGEWGLKELDVPDLLGSTRRWLETTVSAAAPVVAQIEVQSRKTPLAQRVESVLCAEVDPQEDCPRLCPRAPTCPGFNQSMWADSAPADPGGRGTLPRRVESAPGVKRDWAWAELFSTRVANRLTALGIGSMEELQTARLSGALSEASRLGPAALREIDTLLLAGSPAWTPPRSPAPPPRMRARASADPKPRSKVGSAPVLDLSAALGSDWDSFLEGVFLLLRKNPYGLFVEKDLAVLRLYFGLEDGGVGSTLDSIGTRLELTRERSRQLRDRALGVLADLLTGKESIRRRRVSSHPDLLKGTTRIQEAVSQGGFLPRGLIEGLREGDSPPLLPRRPLTAGRGGAGGDPRVCLTPVMRSLGFERILFSGPGWLSGAEVWYDAQRVSAGALRSSLRNLQLLLASEVDWIPGSRMAAHLGGNWRTSSGGWTSWDVLSALFPLERREDGALRVPLSDLPKPGQQARRVLLDGGQPLPVPELLGEINRARKAQGYPPLDLDGKGLRGHLNRTPGLVPISKSGWWKCAEWDWLDASPLMDLMRRVLREAEEPLSLGALVERVQQLRPWAPASTIGHYLSSRPDAFERDANGQISIPNPDSKSRL